MNKKKWIIGGVILIGILALGGFLIGSKKAPEGAQIPEVAYTLEAQTVTNTLFADGIVEAEKEQSLFGEVSGTVKVIEVSVGDPVKVGDLLMTLDTSKLMQSLQQAKYQMVVDQDALKDLKANGTTTLDASLEKASSTYERAKETYANNQILFEAGAISEADLEQSKSAVESAYTDFLNAKDKKTSGSLGSEIEKLTSKIALNRLTIENIGAKSDTFEIRATMDGIITAMIDTVGQPVNAGENLVTISDLRDLTVSAMISEYDIPRIKMGQLVHITTLGAADRVYSGKVLSIAPTGVESGSEVLVEVIISIQDPDGDLKPQFTTNLEILIEERQNVLAVPYDALTEEKPGQFTVTKKTPEGKIKVPVEKGMETDLLVQILSDQLKPGDVLLWADKLTQSDDTKEGSGTMMPPRPNGM